MYSHNLHIFLPVPRRLQIAELTIMEIMEIDVPFLPLVAKSFVIGIQDFKFEFYLIHILNQV